MATHRQLLYIDMDGVIVDFDSALPKITPKVKATYEGEYDNIPGIFELMDPMPGAIEAVQRLAHIYDTYILSSSPWENETALSHKLVWIKKYFGDHKESLFYKKVIFSQAKHLNQGDILIDDRKKNGAGEFAGEFIHFGTDEFPNWDSVLRHLLKS